MSTFLKSNCAENDSSFSSSGNYAAINYNDGGGLFKTVDKEYADLGDILTYSIILKNTGNTVASNIVLSDTISPFISVIGGSVYIDGVLQGVAIPPFINGLSIGSLLPNESKTVVFKAKVISIPNNFIIPNSCSVSFNYFNGESIVPGTGSSNTATTVINTAIINYESGGFIKAVDKECVELNSCFKYTITLINTGNVPANNVLLTDSIPIGTEISPCSLTINSIPVDITCNQSKLVIPIGIILPNTPYVISFKLKVVEMPESKEIKNHAEVSFDYLINPSLPPVSKSSISNEVVTCIKAVDFSEMNFVKEVNKECADLCEEITYTINIKNNGTIPAENVVLQDGPPKNTIFIEDSITINGVSIKGNFPSRGLLLGRINPGSEKIVTFKVKCVTIPSNHLITNTSSLSYNYLIDNLVKTNTLVSNEVVTEIKTAILKLKKESDIRYGEISDEILYSLTIKNIGTTDACGITITDKLDDSLIFVQGSLYKNGCIRYNYSPITGIFINEIKAGDSLVLTFKAKIVSIPKHAEIKNISKASYSYKVCCDDPFVYKTACSNENIVIINTVDFSGDNFIKDTDKDYAVVGEVVTYNFKITNTGNVSANNVVFTDIISNGTTYIEGSFYMNNGLISNVDPTLGVNIDTILPNALCEISFKVLVVSIPSVNPIPNRASINYEYFQNPLRECKRAKSYSNYSNVQINSPKIVLNKSANKNIGIIGKDIIYTIVATNHGNIPCSDVVLRDMLSSVLEFVNGSVTIDNKPSSENIINGIKLGYLNPNESKTVTFTAKIISYTKNFSVINEAICNYTYLLDQNNILINGESKSNKVSLKLENLDISLKKIASSSSISLNDILTFTVDICNNGSITVSNFLFKDILPEELIFEPNSFTVDGVLIRGVNIKNGIRLGNINPNTKLVLTYSVSVIKSPKHYCVTNEAYGEYTYSLYSNDKLEKATTNIAKCSIKVLNQSFKQLNLDNTYSIPSKARNIEEINSVLVNVNILNYYIVKSPDDANRSKPQFKLMIIGDLVQTVYYTAQDDDFTESTLEIKSKFSTFILLKNDCSQARNIMITPTIEDTSYTLLSPREIFTNVVFMLVVNIE